MGMTKRSLFALALAAAVTAPATAAAQTGSPRFSIEPYGAYGFYGRAGESGPRLSESEAYGARAGRQWQDRSHGSCATGPFP